MMLGRLILGLIWLTCVRSDPANDMPMQESAMVTKESMSMGAEDSMGLDGSMSKAKRYLSHQHSSPCPPFYPHFHMHPEPMYAMRPYGPPSYPKTDVHVQSHHQSAQFIHQPTYTSYVPKQTIQYVKPHMPMYHQPVISPQIQHVHPIEPVIVKPPPRWFPYQQHMYEPKMEPKITYHKQPVFAYAPAYHKPMPMIWPLSHIKKIDYPIATYSKPAHVYQPEVPKCAPCPQHQPAPHYVQQPSISYVKVAQPIHQVALPPKVYLPAPSHHQPIMKPCD